MKKQVGVKRGPACAFCGTAVHGQGVGEEWHCNFNIQPSSKHYTGIALRAGRKPGAAPASTGD